MIYDNLIHCRIMPLEWVTRGITSFDFQVVDYVVPGDILLFIEHLGKASRVVTPRGIVGWTPTSFLKAVL